MKKIFKKLFAEKCYWIGIRNADDSNNLIIGNNKKNFNYIKPSIKYWYADPFICVINNNDYLFAEQYDRFNKIGKLCCFNIGENLQISKPKTAIKESFHLSFPNVFLYKKSYYMIPESIGDNSIRIYKLVNDCWVLKNKYILESIVDTAVYIDNDIVYLIASKENKNDSYKDKLVYYKVSDFPNSDPVFLYEEKNYSYISRNGGNIIIILGNHYRVSQNNEPDFYGRFISINKLILDKGMFKEEKIKDITVESYNNPYNLVADGTHTYNYNGKYEVIDCKGYYYNFFNIFTKLLRHIIAK